MTCQELHVNIYISILTSQEGKVQIDKEKLIISLPCPQQPTSHKPGSQSPASPWPGGGKLDYGSEMFFKQTKIRKI